MTNITFKLDTDTIKQIALFESITKAQVSDCFPFEEKLLFIVSDGDIGKAIGKNGSNVKLLESKLNKKIEILEFNKDPLRFTANILRPVEIKQGSLNEGILHVCINSNRITFPSKKVKKAKILLKKYFPEISEVNITV